MSDEQDKSEKPQREMSTVAFPYIDLNDAIEVARAIHSAGGVPLDRDQLAAALGISPVGGNFALKLSATRMFGLLTGSQGRFQLTELGFEVLDASRERAAKAQAFLNVELYKKLYDSFKGRTLPPRPAGLEQAMVSLGVAYKQRDKARHAFDRSARTAGFFPTSAEDRLVMPVTGAPPSPAEPTTEVFAPTSETVGPVPTRRTGLNPFIEGLLDELPERGTPWTIQEQADWLKGAAQIFRILYKGDGEIVITVKASES